MPATLCPSAVGSDARATKAPAAADRGHPDGAATVPPPRAVRDDREGRGRVSARSARAARRTRCERRRARRSDGLWYRRAVGASPMGTNLPDSHSAHQARSAGPHGIVALVAALLGCGAPLVVTGVTGDASRDDLAPFDASDDAPLVCAQNPGLDPELLPRCCVGRGNARCLPAPLVPPRSAAMLAGCIRGGLCVPDKIVRAGTSYVPRRCRSFGGLASGRACRAASRWWPTRASSSRATCATRTSAARRASTRAWATRRRPRASPRRPASTPG